MINYSDLIKKQGHVLGFSEDDEARKNERKLWQRASWFDNIAGVLRILGFSCLGVIIIIHLPDKRPSTFSKETVTAGFLGVSALFFCASWFLLRASKKLHAAAGLVGLGLSLDEARNVVDTEVSGDTTGSKALVLSQEYYLAHKVDIDAHENEFTRLMNEEYGFSTKFTEGTLTAHLAGQPVKMAIFLYRDGVTPEEMARRFYDSLAYSVNRENPAVFARNIETGKETPADAKKPSFLKVLFFGEAYPARATIIISLALFSASFLGLYVMLSTPFTPSPEWQNYGAAVSILCGLAFIALSISSLNASHYYATHRRKPPGAFVYSIFFLIITGLLWMALVPGIGGLATLAIGKEEHKVFVLKRTGAKGCVRLQAERHSWGDYCFNSITADQLRGMTELEFAVSVSWFGEKVLAPTISPPLLPETSREK